MAKRKKRGKKPTPPKLRQREVLIDLGRELPVDEVRIYPDGRVELRHAGVPLNPERAHTQISYDRSKRPKIQSRASVAGTRLASHPNQILEVADRVFWVDTNSRDHSGERVHTTATLLAQRFQQTATHTAYRWQRAHGLEFRGPVDRPEAFAWSETIERVRRNPSRLPHWHICLVVDSDLDLLASINARAMPIWRDYYLPANFSFVYASADVGKHDPLNAMMRLCDGEASRLFDAVVRAEKGKLEPMQESVIGGPSLRVWQAINTPAA